VRKGDRVLLLMQNSPQFVIGYYGILRANAVVVPLNPMNLTQELLRFADDSERARPSCRRSCIRASEPLLGKSILKSVVVAVLLGLFEAADHARCTRLHRRAAPGTRRTNVNSVARRAGERLETRASHGRPG